MIIDVLSPAWFVLLILSMVALYLLAHFTKGKSRKEKLKILTIIHGIIVVLWFGYKLALYMDPEFVFNIWGEFPFHLCNVVTFVSLIAAATDNRLLQSLIFNFGALGALMALLMPTKGFGGVPLFSGRGVYWFYHFAVIFQSFSFTVTRVFEPEYKDVFKATALLVAIAFIAYGINLLFRATVNPESNYFYSFGIPGNPIMDGLRKLIPADFFFIMPMVPLCGLFGVFETWIAQTALKTKAKVKQN